MAVYQLGDITPECHQSAWVAETASVIGNVIMAESSSVWFGATVRGDNEPIKLGARKVIPDNSVVMGSPGKVIKTLSDEQAMRVKMGATVYVANSKRFRENLKRID